MNNDFARDAVDSLRASFALVVEDIAMHNAIKATLAYHIAIMIKHHQKLEVSKNGAREEAQVTTALLRCLDSSTLSDDDDDINNTPEEDARHDLIH